jgi:2'-5' RNA ligase
VAVEIDPAVARKLAAYSEELRRWAATRAPEARITWIPAERLHLTIRFIGEVDATRAAAVAAALAPPLPVAAFDLTFAGTGVFPAKGPPKVVWAEIEDAGQQLAMVEAEVTNRLEACGIAREKRAYRPHLSLARVRDAAGLRSGPLVERFGRRAFGSSRIDAITLFHSRLSPKGPLYVPLQRTPLRAD